MGICTFRFVVHMEPWKLHLGRDRFHGTFPGMDSIDSSTKSILDFQIMAKICFLKSRQQLLQSPCNWVALHVEYIRFYDVVRHNPLHLLDTIWPPSNWCVVDAACSLRSISLQTPLSIPWIRRVENKHGLPFTQCQIRKGLKKSVTLRVERSVHGHSVPR